MKILEVRDGFIKFEADEKICLSSFVQVKGEEKTYVAQVIQVKKSIPVNIAYAKILFLYDGNLLNYDKTLPSKDDVIQEFENDILDKSINITNPVIAGKTPNGKEITVDFSSFENKMLVCSDDKNSNNVLVRNFTKQFNNLSKNVVIIDTLGFLNAKKVVAGEDFKLPLDTASLDFMYHDCLNDATEDSKSLIIEIFKDLSEYSQTVPFLPFSALKNIVDDMVDKSHIFKLLVLKNKLAKFDKLGYFAKNKNEADGLKNIIKSSCSILDLSKLEPAFLNRYLDYIYSNLDSNNIVLLQASNSLSKKSVKSVLLNKTVSTVFFTHSKFQYLNDIKNVFDNFIVVPSETNNKIFNIYSTFLNSMLPNTCLIVGAATNYIPFVSNVEMIDDIKIVSQKNLELEDDTELEKIYESSEVSEENYAEENVSDIEVKTEEIVSDAGLHLNIFGSDEEVQENTDVIEQSTLDVNTDEVTGRFAPEDNEENVIEEEASFNENFETEVHNNVELEVQATELTDNEMPELLETQADAEILEDNVKLEDVMPAQFEGIEDSNITEADSYTELLPETDLTIEIANQDDNLPEINDEVDVNEAECAVVENEADSLENLGDVEENIQILEMPDELQGIEDLQIDEVPEPDDNEISDLSYDSEDNQGEYNSGDINILPISNESDSLDVLDDFVELDINEANEDSIIVDINDNVDDVLSEELDEQIVKDVDKVFTTPKEEDISDSDLDFIDELNNDNSLEEINSDGYELNQISDDDALLEELTEQDELEELQEYSDNGILEEVQEQSQYETINEEAEILETKQSSTPIVPVYDADIPQEDMVMSDPIQQGDTVYHAKYGTGVVEKMIKYGSKTLFSINFDNIGRRLLDPTLTEIKKA